MQILEEMSRKQIPATQSIHECLLRVYIVTRNTEGILHTLGQMAGQRMRPRTILLEEARKRIEAEGDETAIHRFYELEQQL